MAAIPSVAIVATLLLVICGSSETAKILLLPIPGGSHYMNIKQIAVPLIERGHELHVYINYKCRNTPKMADLGITTHTYENPQYGCYIDNETIINEFMEHVMGGAGLFGTLGSIKQMNEMMRGELVQFLSNEVVMKDLAAVGFDLCIVDGLYQVPFFHIIPYKLNIPVVTHLATFNPANAGLPLLPSFTPYINMGEFTNEMSFMERVANYLMYFVFDTAINYMNPGSDSALIAKYAPERPAITMAELQRKSKLWLVMTDVAIDYPQVRMPHVVDIGGINTNEPKPLPKNFQDLADKADRGLIIVSFGTYVANFPEKMKQKLLTAFGKLDQTVIWRFHKTSSDKVPDNVHAVPWIPQNDLLAHPNTKLFITHCGANGQFEALYHAVPMLGIPIFGDQIYNSRRMAKKGLGLHMDFFKSTSDELVSAAREILTNSSYQSTMDMHSAMFKDRAMTPIETAVYWIEHVIKYGSDHLLSPALEYPWYKFYCIDVGIFLLVIGLVLMYFVYTLSRCMCKCLCKLRKGKIKQQ